MLSTKFINICTFHACVKRIIRYLNLTRNFDLNFNHFVSLKLSEFSNADWVGYSNDRKSTWGYCVYFGSHLISKGSKKQPTITKSSTEIEYKVVAYTACEFLWVQSLLIELGIFLTDPPILWCDNLRETYLTVNLVLHTRTKHIELDYYFVQECVVAKALQVAFVSSKDHLAYIFTKPLSSTRFSQLSSRPHNLSCGT